MVEAKLTKLEEAMEERKAHGYFNTEMVGDLLGDQLRQDANVVPRLERLETKIEKLIDIMEKVIQHVT